jgi:glycosyltransferase involved in cell wall biosynthesis
LAHGRPLITTSPTTSTPVLVHGQNVWFVPAADEVALAEAVQNLLADPELRQKLGQEAARVAALFTWDRIAAQTAEFLSQL